MLRLLLILLCLSAMCSELSAVTAVVSDLSGQTIVAQEVAISGDQLRINDQALPLARIDWINWERNDAIDWFACAEGVLLQDGSWIPVMLLTRADKDDHIQLSTPFGPMLLPLEHVAAWGSYEALTRNEQHDSLLLDNGNKPYGELYGIQAGNVLLKTDIGDEPLKIPLSEIKALRLRSQNRQISGMYFDVYTHPQRPPMKVLPGAKPALAAVPSLSWDDWSLCERMQLIGGKRVFLGSLEPASVEERGQFGKVWPYSVNSNIDGSPLFLNKRRYTYGMVLHSYARLSWKLDKRYQYLHSLVGISDQLGQEGDCIVRVLADGKELWQKSSVRGGNQAQPLHLDVSGCTELVIEVDFGQRFDIGDHCAFADAWLSHVNE